MKSTIQFLALIIMLLASCTTTEPDQTAMIQKEIDALTTINAKKTYLENLFKDDQEYRIKEGAVITEFTQDSDEYREHVRKSIERDSINEIKVEAYLLKYGHPDRKTFGEIATITPHTVIHHSSSYESRVRNFHYFYTAHQTGDIDLSMYLNRMYQMKFGKRFHIEGVYKPEDEINALIKALELKTI